MSLPPTYSAASARLAGLTRGQLRGPGFLRLAHDLVVRLDDAIDERERLQLLSSVLPSDATFSHATAAAFLGAPIDAPHRPHVALTPRRVLPQRAEIVVHARRLEAADVVVNDRLARAARVRGVVRARACAPLLSPLAMSRPESLMRYWLVTSDLPDPQPQAPVRDRWGRVVAHGDLGYEEWRVLLEYEGRQHAEAEQFGRDIDRYSLMAADGWLVLRFAARHAESPTVVVDRTRRALTSRGWRPGAR